MPWKPHSTEPFPARVTCEAEDICDDAITDGYMAKSIELLIASMETTWKDDIRRSIESCVSRRMDVSELSLVLSLVLTLGRQTTATSLWMESRNTSQYAI